MAYSSSGTAPFPFHHGKATLGPRNTLSSSKLNRLHVKSVGAPFKQIHICCGFCHFYSQATVNQCCCQQNWSLLWRDNSSSAVGVGRDHCHFACSVLAYYIRLHFVLSKFSTATPVSEDSSSPLPMTVVGTRTLGGSELQSTCHTQSLHLKSHPINSIAMKSLQTSYRRILSVQNILKYLA